MHVDLEDGELFEIQRALEYRAAAKREESMRHIYHGPDKKAYRESLRNHALELEDLAVKICLQREEQKHER